MASNQINFMLFRDRLISVSPFQIIALPPLKVPRLLISSLYKLELGCSTTSFVSIQQRNRRSDL